MMERLSHCIKWIVELGGWCPTKISRKGLAVSHLFFANDLLLFAKASVDHVIKQRLNTFSTASSQKINVNKSSIFFSANMDFALQQDICSMAGMNRTEEIGMYLGVLMIEGCMTKAFFYPLLQKVDSHLAGWKSNMLSFFGRVIMAKSILSTLPNHLIQAMYLPKLVCEEFNKKIQDFIWGDQWANKRVHLVNWHQVTLPVDYVGLGIRTYRKMNMAFLVKLGQRLLKEEDAFQPKIVRGK